MVKVKTDMPDENQQPSPQPSEPAGSAAAPQVIQPTNSDTVSPSSPSSQPQPVVSSPITQPAAMVNGQPFQPTTPTPSSQFEQTSTQKSWTWLYIFIAVSVLFPIGALVFLVYMMIKKQWDRFFIASGILQVVGVALFFGVMASIAGQTGGEFVALLLFLTLVPALGLIALINLIGLPIYIKKHKPQGKGLAFSVLSLIVSVILALYGAYSVYQMRVAAPKHINELSEQSRQKSEQRQQKFAAANVKPEITKEEAISFMQSCKADYFVGYTDINLVKDSNTKSWLNKAEQSTTGIEISEGSPKSYVFASKEMTTALQDTARQFRQSCYNTKKLYITVDNWIETEYPQGKWTRVNQ